MRSLHRVIKISSLFLSVTCLALLSVPSAHAASASLSISPSSGSKTVGSNFTVEFKVDSGGASISGATVDVNYSSNLDYVSADGSGSVLDQEAVAPSPSNTHFKFTRLRFSSGFTGTGTLLKVTFKPTSSGTGTITINKDASEVINDSDTSNILGSVSNASFSLANAAGSTAKPSSGVSASKSTITSTDSCEDKQVTYIVTVKDGSGTTLSGNDYKPTVTVTPKDGSTTTVTAKDKTWQVAVKSTQDQKISVKFVAKGTTLATKEFTFAPCATPSPSPTPTPTIVVTPSPTPPPPTDSGSVLGFFKRVPLYASILFFISLIGIVWSSSALVRESRAESASSPDSSIKSPPASKI